MNFDKVKRAFRLQLPPEHPYEAGPFIGSRVFEALPNILPVVTISFLLISGVLFFFTDIQPGNEITLQEASKIKYDLGFRNDISIILKSPWGLATSAFFHGDFMHIMFNSMALLTLGSMLERGIGSLKTLALYLAFAIVSSGFQVLVSQLPSIYALYQPELQANPYTSSLGLSGILYAIIGFMWGSWKRWTGFLTVFNRRLLKFALFWQIICYVISYTSSHVSFGNTAHMSGLIFGFFCGMWMCYGAKATKLWTALGLLMILLIPTSLYLYSYCYKDKLSNRDIEYLEDSGTLR